MLSDSKGTCPWATVPTAPLTRALCFTAGTHRDPGGRRLTVSKSQLSLPVIEYFQSFQVGCKHLKNIIWNQIPQSPSGVHQRFIDVYDFCWGLWSLRQLRDCWLGVTLAFGWLKALLYSSLFFLLLGSGFSLLLQQHCHSSGHGTISAQTLTSGAGELDPALPLLSARWNSTKGMIPHLSEAG